MPKCIEYVVVSYATSIQLGILGDECYHSLMGPLPSSKYTDSGGPSRRTYLDSCDLVVRVYVGLACSERCFGRSLQGTTMPSKENVDCVQ